MTQPSAPGTEWRARDEWRHGGVLVFIAMLGLMVSVSHAHMLGVLIIPIQQETGWSRGGISSGMLINGVVSIIFAPIVGYAIDKFGPRRLGLTGMMIYCLGVGLLATTGPSLWNWLALWVIVAAGAVLVKPTIWTAAVAYRFKLSRAFAMATVLTGAGIGTALWPVVANLALTHYGWRGAYLVVSLGAAAIMLPLLFFGFKNFSPPGRQDSPAERAPLVGLTIREGFLSPRFYKLMLAAFLMTGALMGIITHFVPITTENGLAKNSAVAIVGLIGLSSITGRLLTGYLLDKFPHPLVRALGFLLAIFGSLLLHQGSGVGPTMAAAILIGLAFGAEIDVIAYLSSRYFGLRNYGTIFGTIVGAISLGGGLGPTLAGFSYDRWQSYDVYLWGSAIALVITTLCILTMGPYPTFEVAENRQSE